jgi:hypothetical protein
MISGIIKYLSTILLSLFILIVSNNTIQAQSEKIDNNLSFVVYSNDVFYGINAGSGNQELRFRFDQQNNQSVLFIDVYDENQFFTIGAYNSRGILIYIQDHPESTHQNRLLPEDFNFRFGKLLFESSNIYDLEFENIDSNNWYLPDSNIVIADTSGNMILLHTHDDQVEIIPRELPYFGVTYLYPFSEFNNNLNNDIDPIHDQLLIQLDSTDENFTFESGFDILTNFYPTNDQLTSILISPRDNQVYVSMDQNAEEIWRLDINGGTVETHAGFDQNHKANIPKLGITTSDLIILNFSNENLTIGIISIAILILLIIIIPTVIHIPKLNHKSQEIQE